VENFTDARAGVSGPASFLRINDLEALSQYGVRYIRSDEQAWSLSH
jgi:hypothetical protein